MRSQQLPKVSEFKYLGSTLQTDGGIDVEINTEWVEELEEDVRHPM